MKTAYLAPLAYSALLLGCAVAYAQTPSTSSANPSATSPTSTHPNTTKGNEVVGNPQPAPADPMSTPASTGQDKGSGNDLVSPNKGATEHGTGMRPGFQTMDTNKNGYLTADDVKSDKWLSKNFSRCDSDHDGHMSKDEFAKCTK